MYANAISVHRKKKVEKCDVRFLLCFTVLNAIAKNRKIEFQTLNGNVSKPSRLPIKVTCRMSKGHSQEAKTDKLAEAFNKN